MSEDAILRAADVLRAAGETMVLATVMQVRGSAYRRPGARMLTSERGWIAGSISGGCLEGDIVKRGYFRTRDAAAVLVTYDASRDDDADGNAASGYGLGCDGVVDVLIERIRPGTLCDPLQFIAGCHAQQTRGVIATVFHSQDAAVHVGDRLLLRDRAPVDTTLQVGAARIAALAYDVLAAGKTRLVTLDAGRLQVLFELIEPPPHLFLFGTGHDVPPVAMLARTLGWAVSVCERHKRVGMQQRFSKLASYVTGSARELTVRVDLAARPMAVIMSHRYELDRELLGALLGSRVLYLGVLGPARRTQRMLTELTASGVCVDTTASRHLHAPVGLDLGAETPAEIALSVIAEAQACLAHAGAARLRERVGAIHAAHEPSALESTPRRQPSAASSREVAVHVVER